jgi:Tfp pilus assembly protein PilF
LKHIFILAITMSVLVCCHPGRFKTEIDFANKLAQQGLWKEAHFRWQKSITRGKETAAAYNNLAVYYEKTGDLKKAESAYKNALKLAPQNKYIVSNYKKFKQKKEINKNEK